jgi:signal transduction histidine kinase
VKAYRATSAELRVLVAAPFGRDAEVTVEMLKAAAIEARPCATIAELAREFANGAGAILVTSEALGANGTELLARIVAAQEPWSDVPLVLATAPGDARARESLALMAPGGAVTVLERPIRLITLQTVIRSALRARQRQYDLRELLEELRVQVERMGAERTVRERFVSLLAHDLRGPLTTVQMVARMLVARPEQLDDRRALALRIERNVTRIDRMIQDLLDANRVRAGHRLALDLQPCDFVEIVSDLEADLPERDRERVHAEMPDRLEGVWDPDQLRRAVWNLVTNALKYGADGAPVQVRVEGTSSEVAVSVHNSGPAIPVEEQPRMFEPFGRSAGSEARGRGWGLGLTLVRACAEAHGGTLDLSSTHQAGTTFTMRLPMDARSGCLRDA